MSQSYYQDGYTFPGKSSCAGARAGQAGVYDEAGRSRPGAGGGDCQRAAARWQRGAGKSIGRAGDGEAAARDGVGAGQAWASSLGGAHILL